MTAEELTAKHVALAVAEVRAEREALRLKIASIADPKARAAAEYDADVSVRDSFSSKAGYVAFRVAELAGRVTYSKQR